MDVFIDALEKLVVWRIKMVDRPKNTSWEAVSGCESTTLNERGSSRKVTEIIPMTILVERRFNMLETMI